MDDENDGKLNFNEFEDHVYNTYESYMDFQTNGEYVPDAKDKFAELDVNKDQYVGFFFFLILNNFLFFNIYYNQFCVMELLLLC